MFTKKDAVHIRNLQQLLSKAKIELQGQEILAAADVMLWVGQLGIRADEDIKRQEMMAKVAQGTDKVTGPEPAPVPESLPEKPKKSKKASN